MQFMSSHDKTVKHCMVRADSDEPDEFFKPSSDTDTYTDIFKDTYTDAYTDTHNYMLTKPSK